MNMITTIIKYKPKAPPTPKHVRGQSRLDPTLTIKERRVQKVRAMRDLRAQNGVCLRCGGPRPCSGVH